jgi:DNA adenine methylase
VYLESEQLQDRQKNADAVSPFRYPGGKAFFSDFLAQELARLGSSSKSYLEPFAGGAGAAIRLLEGRVVDRIFLNDADVRVSSAWSALVSHNERFLEELAAVQPSMENWYNYKRIIDDPSLASDEFELGFATFFLNRTNRGGIIQGAAPIGGYDQNGKWKIDVRFYRETMMRRVAWIGAHASQIEVSGMDAMEFLRASSCDVDLSTSLYFVDPPYVSAGSRLYMNGMTEDDHRTLAKYLCEGNITNWIMTYDDCDLVAEIYGSQHISTLDVRYSLQKKRVEGEVLIRPLAREDASALQ